MVPIVLTISNEVLKKVCGRGSMAHRDGNVGCTERNVRQSERKS